jgi:phage baseplate assembly protein W
MKEFDPITLPVKVVAETVRALIVFEPVILPITLPVIVVIKEFDPTMLPVKVVAETVRALIVFDPRICP